MLGLSLGGGGLRLPTTDITFRALKSKGMIDDIGESSILFQSGDATTWQTTAVWGFERTAVTIAIDTALGGNVLFVGTDPIYRTWAEWMDRAWMNQTVLWLGSKGIAGYSSTQAAKAASIKRALNYSEVLPTDYMPSSIKLLWASEFGTSSGIGPSLTNNIPDGSIPGPSGILDDSELPSFPGIGVWNGDAYSNLFTGGPTAGEAKTLTAQKYCLQCVGGSVAAPGCGAAGAEKFPLGNFDTATGLTLVDATVSGGVCDINTATSQALVATVSSLAGIPQNANVIVEYDITEYTSGSVQAILGSTGNITTLRNAVGHYTERKKLTSNPQYNFGFRSGSSGFVGKVDNLSVKILADATATPESPLIFDGTPGSTTFTPTGCSSWMLTTGPFPKPYVAPGSSVVACRYLSGADNGLHFILDSDTDSSVITALRGYTVISAFGEDTPFLAVTGDSIAEGHNEGYYDGFYGGPSGDIDAEIMHRLVASAAVDCSTDLSYINRADGSRTWAWVLSTGAPAAISSGAPAILVHCGVNDIGNGRTWAAVESDMNAVKALLQPGQTLFIDEVLPWTAGNDTYAAIIRTFNQNYSAWCAANGAMLVKCHDRMGQLRATTGQLDDLRPEYNYDNLHLSKIGVNAMAEIWKWYLYRHYAGVDDRVFSLIASIRPGISSSYVTANIGVLSVNDNPQGLLFLSASGVLSMSDGVNTATVSVSGGWDYDDDLLVAGRTNAAGTQMQIGYKKAGDTEITWGSLTTYDGSLHSGGRLVFSSAGGSPNYIKLVAVADDDLTNQQITDVARYA